MPDTFGKRQRQGVKARKAAEREERRKKRNRRKEAREAGLPIRPEDDVMGEDEPTGVDIPPPSEDEAS